MDWGVSCINLGNQIFTLLQFYIFNCQCDEQLKGQQQSHCLKQDYYYTESLDWSWNIWVMMKVCFTELSDTHFFLIALTVIFYDCAIEMN